MNTRYLKAAILVLFAVCLTAAAPSNPPVKQADARSKPKLPVVELKGSFRGPKILHDKTTAEIESMRTGREPSGWHNPGITISEHVLNTRYQLGIEQDKPGAPFRAYIEKLVVEFGYTKLDVFVANEYAKGSCEYNQVLKHEMEHVNLHRETYRKYKKLLKDSLSAPGKLPTPKRPLYVKKPEEAQVRADKIVKDLTTPIYDRFQKELIQVQTRIDTPANYRAIQKHCTGWKK